MPLRFCARKAQDLADQAGRKGKNQANEATVWNPSRMSDVYDCPAHLICSFAYLQYQ